MLLDSYNQFCSAQALTADAISENVIDLGPLGSNTPGGATANTTRDIGAGTPLYLHVVVKVALASSGATTSLITSLESDSAVGLDASATVHWTGANIEEATLVAGYWIAKGLLIPAGSYERYVGLRFNVGAEEDFTSGTIDAWISDSRYDETFYESGWTTGVN